jgi:hypothetical protein
LITSPGSIAVGAPFTLKVVSVALIPPAVVEMLGLKATGPATTRRLLNSTYSFG